jgi:hypothetical protein
MTRRLAAVVALAAAACFDDGIAFDYPLDGVLRMHHLQAKGTHNSYHVAPGPDFTPWAYTHLPLDEQLALQGVRQLELDLYFFDQASPPALEVHHFPIDWETNCLLLYECLARVKRWSDRNPAHHPVVILLEPKDPYEPERAEALFAKIEGDILLVFPPERIITPDLVRADAPTLREAVMDRGWPTLGEVRGRVLFVLLDSGGHRAHYTDGGRDLPGRLLFVRSSTTEPHAAILLIDDALRDGDLIREAVEQGFLVRTRADIDGVEPRAGDTSRLEAALASGAHMISTDFPSPLPETGYVVDMPGGTPSRCNPITAPADCAPEAIEDPRFFR